MITIKLRRDSATNWVRANPVLANGEPGYEEETGKLKIGNGTSRWMDLKYFIDEKEIAALLSTSMISGQQGPIGPQGVPGIMGPEGPQGVPGTTGTTGATGPQGSKGDPGPVGPAGLTWQGTWNSASDYVINDAVEYNKSSWFAYTDPPVGSVPAEGSAHWAIMAAQGPQGTEGPIGATGSSGAQGPQGVQGVQGIQGINGLRGQRVYSANLSGLAPNITDYPNAINGDTVLDADSGNVWELVP